MLLVEGDHLLWIFLVRLMRRDQLSGSIGVAAFSSSRNRVPDEEMECTGGVRSSEDLVHGPFGPLVPSLLCLPLVLLLLRLEGLLELGDEFMAVDVAHGLPCGVFDGEALPLQQVLDSIFAPSLPQHLLDDKL